MNERIIGIIGGAGRVGRECIDYLIKNTSFSLCVGERTKSKELIAGTTFVQVDVFNEEELANFCKKCFMVINCAGPANLIRELVAMAALKNECHYVDPGGYTPLFKLLSEKKEEIDTKKLTFLLAIGILPGLSEIFPIYIANKEFDVVNTFEYTSIGRDKWTFPSAYDIAWGVGNIGKGEDPVYYENGKRIAAKLLSSGKKIDLPKPIGTYTVFPLIRMDLQKYIEKSNISEAHVYVSNWGGWVTLATIIIRLVGLYRSHAMLKVAARLIMKASKLDMRGKESGFMLHLKMGGKVHGQMQDVTRTLFFKDTYRATGLCTAIGARLVLEGMNSGVFLSSQISQVELFMQYFLEEGYSISENNESSSFKG